MKKVFTNIPEGKRSVGKPRKKCLYDVETGPKKMGVTGWRKISSGGEAWKLILIGGQGPAWTVEPMEKKVMEKKKQSGGKTP